MGNQSDQALEHLQRMIEHGELRPGSMVSERGLMELTGLGRTPVREAIQRLAMTRMLHVHPSKGIEVPAVSVEDQLNGLEVRRTLESLAVTLACTRATEQDMTDMGTLRSALTGDFQLSAYAETVRQTHALIIRAASNPYLDALMTPLQALSRRFWIIHVSDTAREIAEGRALHAEILTQILNRDANAARTASLALNDYLVRFAIATITRRAHPGN